MLLNAQHISKDFPLSRRGFWQPARSVHAVDRVDLTIERGRTLALVGESGSGKTTLGLIVAGLIEPSDGTVQFEDFNVTAARPRERRAIRSHLQFIFQDPFSSLNPRHTVRTILARPYQVHTSLSPRAIEDELKVLMELVGLVPADALLDRYPHQFSGGQRQRIVFARAIALRPAFIVADEPVSSLDMSVKAQLLTLLRQFQQELDLTYLFITHELSVVRTIAADVAVMYLGRIVESAPTSDALERPLHPYTHALVAATLSLNPEVARARVHVRLRGTMPSPVDPPSGCHFSTRCPFAQAVCAAVEPPLRVIGKRAVACHFVGQPSFPLTANLPAGLHAEALESSKRYDGPSRAEVALNPGSP